MKKLVYLFIALFMGAHTLYAQDCATGYCPSTIVVHHKIGDLSAASGDITYNVVKITTTTVPTCWITRNLGATVAPTSAVGYSSNLLGWLYQINCKQGYNDAVTNAVPIAADPAPGVTAWSSATDPCTLTFGAAWHVPTQSEFTKATTGTTWAASPQLSVTGSGCVSVSSTWVYSRPFNTLYCSYHVQDFGASMILSGTGDGGASTGLNMNAVSYSSGAARSPLLPVRCVKNM
jgi:hypothetical protein